MYINGEELKEDYLEKSVVTEAENGAYTDIIVPDNCVFAMETIENILQIAEGLAVFHWKE